MRLFSRRCGPKRDKWGWFTGLLGNWGRFWNRRTRCRSESARRAVGGKCTRCVRRPSNSLFRSSSHHARCVVWPRSIQSSNQGRTTHRSLQLSPDLHVQDQTPLPPPAQPPTFASAYLYRSRTRSRPSVRSAILVDRLEYPHCICPRTRPW